MHYMASCQHDNYNNQKTGEICIDGKTEQKLHTRSRRYAVFHSRFKEKTIEIKYFDSCAIEASYL